MLPIHEIVVLFCFISYVYFDVYSSVFRRVTLGSQASSLTPIYTRPTSSARNATALLQTEEVGMDLDKPPREVVYDTICGAFLKWAMGLPPNHPF